MRSNLTALLFSGLLLAASPVRADEAIGVAQLACTPEINYFSISTRYVWNIDPHHFRRSDRFALTSPEDLQRHPFVCRLKGDVIRVEANTRSLSGPSKECETAAHTNLEITFNGTHLDTLTEVDCFNRRYNVAVTINSYFPAPDPRRQVFVEHCVVDTHSVPPKGELVMAEEGEFRCETNLFNPATGQLGVKKYTPGQF
jgi:hypothetical protein